MYYTYGSAASSYPILNSSQKNKQKHFRQGTFVILNKAFFCIKESNTHMCNRSLGQRNNSRKNKRLPNHRSSSNIKKHRMKMTGVYIN